MLCEECPKLKNCDEESMKDLTLASEIIKGLNKGYLMQAIEAAEDLHKRLEKRHLEVTGRG